MTLLSSLVLIAAIQAILVDVVAAGASSVKEGRNLNRLVHPKELGFYPSGSQEPSEIHGRELYTQDYAMFTTCGGLPTYLSARVLGVVANSCYLCTNAGDGTRQSCKFTLSQSGSALTASFDTYSDTSCSAGTDTYFLTTFTEGVCISGTTQISLHSDVSDVTSLLPTEGVKTVEYASDCSLAPVGFASDVYIKDACSGDTGAFWGDVGDGSSMAAQSCDGTTIKYDVYSTTDCSGSATAYEFTLGTCLADTVVDGWSGIGNLVDDGQAVHTTTKEDLICTTLGGDSDNSSTAASTQTIIIIVVAVLGGACLLGILVYAFFYMNKPADGHSPIAVKDDEAGAVESGEAPDVKATELTTASS
jgi:hypothetical protein